MPGGLLQLAAYGAQDLYLTGNPQITFWKTVYRRHSNFAMENIYVYLDTAPNLTTTTITQVQVKIPRNGDLLSNIYFTIDMPDIYSNEYLQFKWIPNFAQRLVRKASVSINGMQVDQQYSQWLNIWSQLSLTDGKRISYDNMTANIPDYTQPKLYYGNYGETNIPTINARRVYVPLPFWFCLNPGLAIPLVALQRSDVYVDLELAPLNDLFTIRGYSVDMVLNGSTFDYIADQNEANQIQTYMTAQGVNDPNNWFWFFVNGSGTPTGKWSQNYFISSKYIYLDDDERRKFAQSTHEYLITQVDAYSEADINVTNYTLNFKFQHPSKEIILVTQRNDVFLFNQWFNYTGKINHNKVVTLQDLYTQFVKDPNLNSIENLLHPLVNEVERAGRTADGIHIFDDAGSNLLLGARLLFNGNERFENVDYVFLNYLQPYEAHTFCPDKGVYVYSFSLNPENFQPSGSANFSRINKAEYELRLRTFKRKNTGVDLTIYTYNFNVLRIMGGLGGLVFSN